MRSNLILSIATAPRPCCLSKYVGALVKLMFGSFLGTIAFSCPADEAYPYLVNAAHQLGDVTHVDRSSFEFLEFLVRSVSGDAISVYADDWVGGIAAKYTQPSWNMRSIYLGFNDPTFTYSIVTKPLSDNVALSASLVAGGFSVYRFKGHTGTDALVGATGSGGSTMPSALMLSVIRRK